MKKITMIILFILLVILAIGYIYLSFLQPKSELPDYYKNLTNECKSKESYGCCISSVNYMAKGNFKLIPGTGCLDGYGPNTLECIDSFRWCEPIK